METKEVKTNHTTTTTTNIEQAEPKKRNMRFIIVLGLLVLVAVHLVSANTYTHSTTKKQMMRR